MAKKKTVKVISLDKINKKYGSGTAQAVALSDELVLRIPSRILSLNHQLNGGIPYGKIIEIFGPESTGKSLLSTDFAYCTIQLGGEIIWADAENSWSNTWAAENGIDLEKVHLLSNENSIEVISDWAAETALALRSRLTNNEPILLVIDSTAALDTLDNDGASQVDKKAEMGNRAKKIYEFFRIRNKLFGSLGVSVILINQLRKKVGAGMFEDPDTTPGGMAARFYASLRLSLIRSKAIKQNIRNKKDVKVGNNVIFRTVKDKTGPPRDSNYGKVYFRKCSMDVGFDRYFGLPELLVDLEVLHRKKGNTRYYPGKKLKDKYPEDKMFANGEDAMLELIRTDADLRSNLIKASKINTISRTLKKMEKINTNLFPVKVKASDDGDE